MLGALVKFSAGVGVGCFGTLYYLRQEHLESSMRLEDTIKDLRKHVLASLPKK
jgi:hypothetical protein